MFAASQYSIVYPRVVYPSALYPCALYPSALLCKMVDIAGIAFLGRKPWAGELSANETKLCCAEIYFCIINEENISH